MLDVGWTELVVIAVVLIIVVGPKDLPPMLRTFGKMMTKMRGMASDFRQQFDEALKEADLDDVRKTLSDAQKLNPAHSLREAMNPLRQMGNEIKADLQKATAVDAKPVEPKAGEQKPVESKPAEPSVPLESNTSSGALPNEIAAAAVVPQEQPVSSPAVARAIDVPSIQTETAVPIAAEPKAKRAKPKVGDAAAVKKAVKSAEKPAKPTKKKDDA
ncbi:Sec-independent protein translocase protein TatB [Pararhizobium gei]|uniref:Sec-independent protein translocase protein TatB n=1 Tax=Pararhizobium gei TaxID=1395951 RepID=UPI0023DBF517|nr:Sec-independent protein translocase protein TatB [Rhizobium gei]